ncbi:acetyl-CoA C-acetyltransferase [Novosphingobium mangrovi (ex Huang et al. 2023)]|uniref:Acetyl-CoA C-acetyltransferase n=1 Tax=Novosphingobium mangrovi (ex Huang et al. 2023) TaxID=2976432 RepID=A0ABT2I8D0_9SPHN|nr:acetyl-CoA C-acetyltransferase [Novosphingobium mangrovi (ex Huang et al. 2023)]MCT2400797.1 acetyl-CoA C-acetyltransferase [Novosphingobium mangrovi (ex Huang et al. 2023)]
MTEAYIIDAVRTPRGIGKMGKGALSKMHPEHLSASVLAALKERNDFDTAEVDDVIWGVSAALGLQAGDIGRMAALDAGYDVKAGGVTLNRFCGSSITSTNFGAAMIKSGMADLIVSGGMDMLSYANMMGMKMREAGVGSGGMGVGNPRLQAKHPQSNQGVCADAIAAMEGITREELEQLGVESQRRAAKAIAEGRFAMSTIVVKDDEGNVILDHEEYPRPETTAESLAQLKPAFEMFLDMPSQPGGKTYAELINQVYPDIDIKPIHHVGISSGVVDGASAILLASKEYAEKHGLKPRARIVAMAETGDCPTLMLNGPVPAANKVLAKAGLTKDDIDTWEINEAFAVVVEKFIRDLDLDRAKVNPNGGSIALGHPIAGTGAILIGTALDELERTGGRYGLITMCAAGGMAPAIIIERI